MSAFDDSRENYSVCMAYSECRPDGKRIHKWYRIADYHSSAGSSLWPSLIADDFRSPAEKRAYPDHLYNPKATIGFDDRVSDLYVFEWRQDNKESSRILARPINPSSVFPCGCEPKEVIFAVGVSGKHELRTALANGIPFEGRTSRIFYLVFDSVDNGVFAARCEKKDFDFVDGFMRLRPKLSNFRTDLSVPVVKLENSKIIASRHNDVLGRNIYAYMDELPEMSRLPLRPLTDYVAEYVSWFAREENKGLSRTDRQKISSVIEEAMLRPDVLEKYLSAGVPEDEVHSFLVSLVAYARDEEDPVKTLIRDELLKDEEFVALCQEEVLRESAEAIAAKQEELRGVMGEVEDVSRRAASIEEEIKRKSEELESIKSSIGARTAELDRIISQRDEVFGEYETNIALRLGLRAAAHANSHTSRSHICVDVRRGTAVETTKTAESLPEAIDRNLGSLGVRPCPRVPSEVRGQLATSIAAALSVTRFFAIPSPLAQRVADALSIAMFGSLATRVYVPTDCRDLGSFSELDDEPIAVVLIENLIDAVNEGALIALLGRCEEAPVVLSFTSHASADLMAKEVWDRVFVPASEALVAIGDNGRVNKCWKSDYSPAPCPHGDDVFSRMAEIENELDSPALPYASLLLPASVLEAAEDFGGLNLDAVAQHLVLAGTSGDGVVGALSKAVEDDFGLSQIARRLGRDA